MTPVVLGIDTSGRWCSAALLHGETLHVRRTEVGNAHSSHLFGMVGAVLDEAGLRLVDCDVLAFGAGPGSFTGLRVACAAAQGLAFGADLRVAAVGTLDAIAHSVLAGIVRPATLLVAHDARMGEVYWSLFALDERSSRVLAGPALGTPVTLRAALAALGIAPVDVGCGNAWDVHGDAMAGLAKRVVSRAAADAADVAALGLQAWHDGRLVSPDQAHPLYVRNDVAQTTSERLARKRAASAVSGPSVATASSTMA